MKFSLIHPSRGRCQLAYKAFEEWMSKSSDDNEIEYILSIDSDDPQRDCYENEYKETNVTLVIAPNRSLIDAINTAAESSTGDILIVVSDDFGCPDEWDRKLRQEYGKTNPRDISMSYAIHINDTITTREQGVMTLPILSRTAYERLGHIYNPIYFSMWADNELYDVCKKNGWLIHSDLIFEHRHYTNPNKELKSSHDATYQRENSQEAWKSGKKIYETRRANGFK